MASQTTAVQVCLKELQKELKKLKKQVQRVEAKQDTILCMMKQQDEANFNVASSQYKVSYHVVINTFMHTL